MSAKRSLPQGLKYHFAETTSTDVEMLTLTRACATCNVSYMVLADVHSFNEWLSGTSVQDAFPTMPASDRELFFMPPAICGMCWTEMFPLPDEPTTQTEKEPSTVKEEIEQVDIRKYAYKCAYCKYDFNNYTVFGCENSKKRNVCSICCDCCGTVYVNGKKCFYYALPHPDYVRDKNAASVFGDVKLTRRGKIVLAIALLLFVSLVVYLTRDYMWFDGRYQKINDVIKHMPTSNPSILPEEYTP